MDTDALMHLSLEMVSYTEVPGDCAIYVPGSDIQRVLIGIDIGPAELMLAKQLGFDCVIAHHPAGAVPDRFAVYQRHALQLKSCGVPEAEADRIVEARRTQLQAVGSVENYDRVPSVARLLNLPFLNIHNPWDELGRRRMQGIIDEHLARVPDATVAAVIEALAGMPEFQVAATTIELRAGSMAARAGRVVVSHGAYTNGGYAVASAFLRHGADTVLCIHFPVEDAARIQAEGLGNLIVSGHIASDTVGITPFIAELRRRGLAVVTLSGVLDIDVRDVE